MSTCLLAGMLAAGCSQPVEDAGWLDYFDPVDSLHVADSVLVRLLPARDSSPNGLWRVPGLGSQGWLRSPADGRRTAEAVMERPPDVDRVPYWPSWALVVGARAGGTVYGAMDFVYVIRAYGADGSWADSIFTAPPSWRQARRPEPGEFANATDAEVRAYFNTFDVITGLAAVSERVLIVAHGRFVYVADHRPNALGRVVGWRTASRATYAISEYVNVYVGGIGVVTDAPAPGEIFGYGPGRVVFGKRGGDRTGYILTEFAWQRPS
ncbi:MAG: hypothetical protein J4F34_05455 [Gemmatimonadetes bacterium]|nr:hypothetical protein [Gemmatimonadota bacterium]